MMNLRVAIRSLWKSPTFAVVSVTVLALGIGANTAIFSVVDAVLLRPLPYKNPERIVAVQAYWAKTQHTGQISFLDFLDWRKQSQSFDAMAFYAGYPHSIFVNDTAAQINAAIADPQLFKVLGVQPQLGRVFVDADTQQSGNPVMVIGDSLFHQLFHGDPHALGKLVKMDQHEFTIVGVMPPGFDFPQQSELWIPNYSFYGVWGEHRSAHNYRAVGLLKPNVGLQQVQAEMNTIAARLAQQYPADDSQEGIAVSPLHDELVSNVKITLYLLIAAVGLILLIACANVANLLLTKVAVRRREMAIRTALGASRSHIIRQLLTESLVLAILAGALGLVIGSWAAQGLAHVTPAALIANSRIGLDWRVALFAFIASLLCTVVFGLAPALQASNADVRGALHAAGSGSVKTGGMGGLRASIVVAEIAMSMALLVGAAILVRSLVALNSVDPGYRVQGLTAMRFSYPAATPDDSKQAVRFYATVLEKGASTPGLRDIAATNALPMESTSDGSFSIAGRPDPEPGDFFKQSADFMLVSPNYFHALGIGFITGRDFDEHDNVGGQFTCIINQALAQKYFPGQDSIGQRIQTGYDIANFMTVVGVVSGVRQSSLQQPPSPLIYMPYQQHPLPATNMQVIFRDSGSGATALRSEAHRLNPEVVVDFKPVESVVDESFAPSRFRSGLLSLFAGLALLLAVAGLYGVMSYAVAQRRNEIGVRVALGAQKSHVMQLILGQGLWLVLPGVLFGAALAFGAGKLFVSLVYGVQASDPLTFIAIAALLVVVALLAMYIPARRAAGADPMLALRSE